MMNSFSTKLDSNYRHPYGFKVTEPTGSHGVDFDAILQILEDALDVVNGGAGIDDDCESDVQFLPSFFEPRPIGPNSLDSVISPDVLHQPKRSSHVPSSYRHGDEQVVVSSEPAQASSATAFAPPPQSTHHDQPGGGGEDVFDNDHNFWFFNDDGKQAVVVPEETSSSLSYFKGRSSTTTTAATRSSSSDNSLFDASSPFREYQQDQWAERFQDLVKFQEKFGHVLVPHDFPPNQSLAQWIKRQRYQYKLKKLGRHSTLTDARQEALERIHFVWDSHQAAWMERLESLKAFKSQFGHTNVPTKFHLDRSLAIWVKCQRRQMRLFRQGKKKSTMTLERFQELERLGFDWDPRNLQL